MINKLQGQGVKRSWLIERFVEIDKAVATSLSTIAERIRTRRWRERERAKSMEHLHHVFRDLKQWTERALQYCQRAEAGSNPGERETLVDAACFSILKVGELINKVERMQHGFWRDFSAAHFLDMHRMRNLLAHTDDLTGEVVIPIGTGIVQDIRTAVEGTLFPQGAGSAIDGYLVSGRELRGLAPINPGEEPNPENSIAMIYINEHERFVICRVGRTAKNTIAISSSVRGKLNLSIRAVPNNP